MSRTQLAYNMNIEGGLLPMLAGLIPFLTGRVLPVFRVGELLGLAGKGVKKLIGNSLYLEKGGHVCVRLKLMGEGCTEDQQAVKDLKL